MEVSPAPNPEEHLISYGDVLYLTFNTEDQDIQNLFITAQTKDGGIPGTVVQEDGTISIPFAGTISVVGKTIAQARKLITNTLKIYMATVDIDLRLNGFRIVMLGSFHTPGIKQVPGNRISIIEAIGLSGDLINDGKPYNIKVIRQTGKEKVTYTADLTDVDIFKSEVYFLQSNDIVYAEKLPRSFARENITYISIFLTIVNTVGIFLLQAGQ